MKTPMRLLVPLLLATVLAAEDPRSPADFATDKALAEVETLVADVLPWLATLHDPATGGFFPAPSSRQVAGLTPTIESTAQSLSIIKRSGALAHLPAAAKEGLVAFFRSRQDPATGFFLDPQPEMRNSMRMRGRALGYSVGALKKLDAEPAHPLPGDGEGAERIPAHLASTEAFRAWIAKRPWDYAWAACGDIQSQTGTIAGLPEARREALLTVLFDELGKRQAEDGLWDGGEPYVRLSGAFKAVMAYRKFGREIPRLQVMYRSVVAIMKTEQAKDFCWVRNPVDMLETMREPLGGIPAEDLPELIRITVRNMAAFKQPDGGFSRGLKHSLTQNRGENDLPPRIISKGLAEGDTNASSQAFLVRGILYRWADREAPPAAGIEAFHAALDR